MSNPRNQPENTPVMVYGGAPSLEEPKPGPFGAVAEAVKLSHLIDTLPSWLQDELRGRSALDAIRWLADELQRARSAQPGYTLDDYQTDALRTASRPNGPDWLNEKLLGLAEEAGEVLGVFKKGIHHSHGLDRAKVVNELGDVLWYVSCLALYVDAKLSEVAEANRAKLKRRYPDGFSSERSINRTEEP